MVQCMLFFIRLLEPAPPPPKQTSVKTYGCGCLQRIPFGKLCEDLVLSYCSLSLGRVVCLSCYVFSLDSKLDKKNEILQNVKYMFYFTCY